MSVGVGKIIPMTPEQKLKRFLQYGRELTLYEPGDRMNDKLYMPNELHSIDEFIERGKFNEPVAIILKAFGDGYSPYPNLLVYALAYCAKQKKSVQLTTAAYKALKTVCATPENLFLFIKYAVKFSSNHSIWGNGFRKVVKDWYLKKDPKTLAEIVTNRKSCHGWRHKDVMKLVHLKSDDPAIAAIIKYVLYGIGPAKKEYGDKPGASEVLNYIQSIEDFRRMTDAQQAARTLETLHLTLNHVPIHFLKNCEIWKSLAGNLPLGDLIKNLERLGYLGFLESTSPVLPRVLDALQNESSIAESRLHPAQVFVGLKKYETSSKHTAAEDAQRKKRKIENRSGEPNKSSQVPPQPNPKVVEALHELLLSTSKLFLAPTGLSYRVDVRIGRADRLVYRMAKNCTRCPHVSSLEATAVTILCLLKADQNVDVVACNYKEYVPVPLSASMSVQAAMDVFKKDDLFHSERRPYSHFSELTTKSLKYDVFIILMERTYNDTVKLIFSNFQLYKYSTNFTYAKLVIIQLTGRWKSTWCRNFDYPDMLEIIGFDENVPRIIEAFSRGAF